MGKISAHQLFRIAGGVLPQGIQEHRLGIGIVALYCLPEKVMVTLSPQIKGIHIGGLDRVGADTLALQEGHIEMAHFLIAHFLQCVYVHRPNPHIIYSACPPAQI